MTEISQRYARLADAFAAKIAAVPDDRWACPSPCEGWTARDVVRHVIDSQESSSAWWDAHWANIPSVDDDPLGAGTAARSVVQRDLENLENTERASAQYEGFGRVDNVRQSSRVESFGSTLLATLVLWKIRYG